MVFAPFLLLVLLQVSAMATSHSEAYDKNIQ